MREMMIIREELLELEKSGQIVNIRGQSSKPKEIARDDNRKL